MANDNVTSNPGSGGATFRTYADSSGVEHPANVVEYATTVSAGANVLAPVTPTAGLPVQPQTGATWAITDAASDPAFIAPGSTTAPTKGVAILGKTADGTPAYDVIPLAAGGGSVAISASALPLPTGAAQDATLTGGSQVSIVKSGAKGTSSAALVTSTAQGSNNQSLDTNLYYAGSAIDPRSIRALTSSDVISAVPSANASGGATPASYIMGASTNATSVKGSAGVVYNIVAFNNSATIAYLKLYDSATTPTAGAGTPVQRYLIPANTSGAGYVIPVPVGLQFSSGIGFTCTGGIADNDTTALSANTVLVNLAYK